MLDNVNVLKEHVLENGIVGLLPQNLPTNLLDALLQEIDSQREEEEEEEDKDENEKSSAALLLMCILYLLSNDVYAFSSPKKLTIEIKDDELVNNMNIYSMALSLELLRRVKALSIDESTLPTLENIFNENRNIDLTMNEFA